MAGILTVSPLENPAEYDRIVIAGVTSGLVEVTGAERSFDWDAKKSAGSQGTTITYRGWDLATPKLKFKFWTAAQIDAFYQSIVPAIYYDADKSEPQPYDVYHPALFANQIFWLVTKKIGDLIDEGAQLWTVTVETTEYRKATAKNATATPTTANTAQNGAGTKPSVLDDQDREIQKLYEEFKKPF